MCGKMTAPIRLKRALSLPMIVLYGLGTTIGAGIYALVGELAGVAGYLAPASFLIASIIASLTAFSFAELSGRFPQAAGPAYYVSQAFQSKHLSTLVGLLVVMSGFVSTAALVNGFVGYLHEFVSVDRVTAIVAVSFLLAAIAAWGIAESVFVASIVTLIETGGLLFIIFVCHGGPTEVSIRWSDFIPGAEWSEWNNLLMGSLLAFYAFIGFEDMVVVAEEVKNVRRNLPLSILITLGITTLLYLLVMTTAVTSLTPQELSASEAPLTLLYERSTGESGVLISIIGMFAIINGALIQTIMASRVLYGLGTKGQLPLILSWISPYTRTPLVATALTTTITLILALLGGLAVLASMTSIIMLVIFSIVNLALIVVKRRQPKPSGVIVFPFIFPLLAFIVSAGFVIHETIRLLLF